MRISWNSFAQRRNLNLGMFSDMTYEQYTAWCTLRRVTPAPLEDFCIENQVITKTDSVAEPTIVSNIIPPAKELKKLRKAALIELCEQHDQSLNGNETKNRLIRILLSMNK